MMRTRHLLALAVLLLVLPADRAAAEADPAVAAARAAVAKDPEDADARLALADALRAAGDEDGARTVVEDGLDLLPESAPLWLRRGDLDLALGLRLARSRGDALFTAAAFHDAIRSYGRARELDPEDAAPVYGAALATYYLGERDKARRLAGECVSLDPRHAPGWTLRADVLYDLRRWAEAAEAYRQAVALAGSDVRSWVRIGHCHWARGQADEAKAAYLDALRHHPSSGDPIVGGLLHVGGDDWEKALPVLEEAAEAVPRSPAIHYYIGWCHFRAERWDAAAAAFRKALARGPDVIYASFLGRTEEARGDLAAALDAYRAALRIDPGHLDCAERFDRIVRTHTSPEEIERLYEELCELAPENPWVHNNYGYWLRNWAERNGGGSATRPDPPPLVRRRLERAVEIYVVAARLAPDSPQLQSDTGLAHEFYPVTRDDETAARFFRRAVELGGDALYRDALNGLMRIHRRGEDWRALRRVAGRVVEGLEAGRSAVAPTGGPPVELAPAMRARFLENAKRMLELADEKLGARRDRR